MPDTISLMDMIMYVLSGAGVGFAVGLTGVGGGSLMTPLLILFNFPTHIAIGTDLMYAAITKAGGMLTHSKQKTVEWSVVFKLGCGSVPACFATLYLLKYHFGSPEDYQHILMFGLGLMLIATALVILIKSFRTASYKKEDSARLIAMRPWLTVVMGVFLGICVTLTSVGAGAFGAAVLLALYPRMRPVTIIGTDIAHAVPLTFIAGLGHMQLGHVDFFLLAALITGSLPAIHFGSKLSKKMPSHLLQPILAIILMVIGIKYAFVGH